MSLTSVDTNTQSIHELYQIKNKREGSFLNMGLYRSRICRNRYPGMRDWGPFEDVSPSSRVTVAHAYQITTLIWFNPNIRYKSAKYVFDNLIKIFKIAPCMETPQCTKSRYKTAFLRLGQIFWQTLEIPAHQW